MKPFGKILILDVIALVGSFFLIWQLATGSNFLIPHLETSYIQSLPLALMYTALVAVLIVLGTVILFLPRRKRQ